MRYLRMIVEWIASLESGRQFRKWVSIFLKFLGVLVLVGAIVLGMTTFIGAIGVSRYSSIGAILRGIGAILGLCINVVVGIILVMLFWNRSNKINALGDESHFTLFPIVVVLTRLLGEVGFISCIVIGVQALAASAFGLGRPLGYMFSELGMGFVGMGTSFIFGVVIFMVSSSAGVILLIVSYFIAEQINLLLDMATNLKKIEATLSTEEA